MSSLVRQTRQLERVIRRKEKIFLMEQYAASMLEQLEPTAAETEADAQVLDALRIAYRYVNPTLGARLSDLLVAYGYTGDLEADREAAEEAESATFEEEEEEERGKPAPAKSKKGKGSGGGADSADGADEDEEAGVLFERDIYTGRKTKKKSDHSAADGEDAADLFAEGDEEGEEGDAADLFADEGEDSETSPGAARKGKAKHRRSASGDTDDEGDPADLFADDDGAAEADDLFADDGDGEDEAEDSGPGTASKGKTKARNASSADDEDDPADLFADEDGHTSGGADDLFASEDAGEDEDPKAAKKKKAKGRSADSDTDDEGDAADLFADDDAEEADDSPAKAKKTKGRKASQDNSEEGDSDGEGDAADLFADDDAEEADDTPAKAKKTKGRKASQDDSEEHDSDGEGSADDLFAEDDTEEGDDTPTKGKKTKNRQAGAAADGDEEDAADRFEEDEDAGALFEQDIYTSEKKKKKKKKRRAKDGEEEPDLVVDEAEDKESRHAPKKTGRERRETPGFAAPEGAVERDERNRQGFAPVNVNLEAEEALESRSKVRKRPGAGRPDEEEEEEEEETKTRRARPGARSAGEEEEEEEEEPGNRRATKPKRDPRAAAEEEKEEKSKKQGREAQAADPKAEEKKLNLDALAFQVSVEDLRTHMGLSLVREDHVKLMRRWEQKSRDNSIRLLLDDPKATQHPYALIPRVTRFIKDGQIVQVNVLSLVRHFFQLFENVPQVVQLKSEPFFVTELPTLEWAVVACEALPDTLNKTVLEQRTVFGQYIQKFMSNERRVRRRVLVEALYDIIVLNMVCKEPILRKTVDLTETRRGRQQQMCVNFGAKGIRVSSIGRDQRHPQMGMCPSW